MQQIAFAFLWLFIFTIPWESVVVIPGFGGIPRLVGLAALGFGILLVLVRGMRTPSVVFLVSVVFVAWAAASLIWTIDAAHTQSRIWTYVQLLGMIWLILDQTYTEARRESLMRAYVTGAMVASVGNLWSFLQGEARFGYEERYAAGLFDPNELGVTLSMAVPMAWFLSLRTERSRSVWMYRAMVPLMAFAVLLTASRSSLVALVLALLAIPWTASNLRKMHRVAISVSLSVMSYVAFFYLPTGVLARLSTIGAELGDMNSRTDIWRAGLSAFLQHPIFGVGAGSFQAAVEPLLGVGWSGATAAHNSLVAVVVELGVVGLLVFLTLLVLVLARTLQMPTATRRIGTTIFLAWGVGASTLSWDYKKPTWFLIGILAATTRVSQSRNRPDVRAMEPVFSRRLSTTSVPVN